MALTGAVRLAVEEASQVAPARRAAEAMAGTAGLGETRRAEAAIVVTELATNLLRHGGGGEIVLRAAPRSLDVLAWDRGRGIGDVDRSVRDGYSTAGGAGTGLGAVRRLAASVDLYTAPGHGTVILARMAATRGGDVPTVDGLALALRGEPASGDAWAQAADAEHVTVLLADGLGHGPDAAAAAATAVRELKPGLSPEALLERMHGALRATRGAAAAVARYDLASGDLRFAGVGNIAASIVTNGRGQSLASMSGTLGHRVGRIHGFAHHLEPDALLVMHSDGCQTNWDLARHPGLARRDPLVIAGLMIRDHERGRDDVSVVVGRRAVATP